MGKENFNERSIRTQSPSRESHTGKFEKHKKSSDATPVKPDTNSGGPRNRQN